MTDARERQTDRHRQTERERERERQGREVIITDSVTRSKISSGSKNGWIEATKDRRR